MKYKGFIYSGKKYVWRNGFGLGEVAEPETSLELQNLKRW